MWYQFSIFFFCIKLLPVSINYQVSLLKLVAHTKQRSLWLSTWTALRSKLAQVPGILTESCKDLAGSCKVLWEQCLQRINKVHVVLNGSYDEVVLFDIVHGLNQRIVGRLSDQNKNNCGKKALYFFHHYTYCTCISIIRISQLIISFLLCNSTTVLMAQDIIKLLWK